MWPRAAMSRHQHPSESVELINPVAESNHDAPCLEYSVGHLGNCCKVIRASKISSG